MGKNFFQKIFGIESAEEQEKNKLENQKLQGSYADAEESEPASDEEKQEQQDREWENIHEQVKYVCQGGKAQCKYHASPADLIATSTQVMLQDKPYMTDADTDGKTNFLFTGLCTHSSHGSKKPPCKSVINLGKWKNVSTTYVDNYKPLLVQSTIPCMISGEDLKIIDSGQIAELVQIEPKIKVEPRIIKVSWLNNDMQEINKLGIGQIASIQIETEDILPNEILDITIDDPSGQPISLKGSVNKEGILIIKDIYHF